MIALAALGALGGVGYAVGVPYLERKVFKTEVALTEIALVSPAQSVIDLTATGYVVPQRVSKVGAKISGRVAEVAVEEGQLVKAGQLLVRLEGADKKSAISAAKARVAAAQAKVHTARANLLEGEQKLARQRKLKQRGVAAAATVEDLEARNRALSAMVKAALAEVRAARAQVKTLQVDLDYTVVRAPIDGKVMNKPVEVGERVGPDTSILELADMSSIRVEVDVPEARLHQVRPGGPCEILLDAYPGKRLRGKVEMISPKVNRAKATATVKVAFVDQPSAPDARGAKKPKASKSGGWTLLPEMAARVSFLQKALDAEAIKAPPKLVVPSEAVVDRAGAKVVFIVDGERVKMRTVTLGPPFGGGFELKGGPRAGTQIVSRPPETLTDGQRIKPKSGS